MIEIWQPRWHDRKVLIATFKVDPGDNVVIFTKTKSLPGRFHISAEKIRQCPVESNGRIDCYAVPLSYLEKEP
jgi:hypothetical protein